MFQNSAERSQKGNNSSENKKSSTKKSPWKHGFVQFLRKKRQNQGYRSGSRNNNDSINSTYHLSTTRNGHGSYGKTLVSAQDDNTQMETQFTTSPLPSFSGIHVYMCRS